MSNANFMNADDVAKCMGISVSAAYRLIRGLNKELKDNGYLTISGKVSKKYFYERTYGMNEENENACI